MRAVEANEEFPLRSPKDGHIVRKISARALWIRLLTCRVETGEPYFIYIDHVNKAIPQHHKLANLEVKMSNLCSEITLPTGIDKDGEERTAVCCLCSLNLETWFEWEKEAQFIPDVMRFLDNVLQDFIEKAPDEMERARYSAMRERSVGLGVMGAPLILPIADGAHRIRHGEGLEQEDLQAYPYPGRRRLSGARRGTGALPGCRRLRHHGTVLQQDGDRAHRVHFPSFAAAPRRGSSPNVANSFTHRPCRALLTCATNT